MHRLDRQTVNDIATLLHSYDGSLWATSEYLIVEEEVEEVNDIWEMLHITLHLASYPSPGQLRSIREELTNIIHHRLPTYPKTHSWHVSILHQEELVDSIMGGMNGIVI